MNLDLQKLFSILYSPIHTGGNVNGASSIPGTAELRGKIVNLFKRRNINSIFDAGCNDCNWMSMIEQYIKYRGGDISLAMVADAWIRYPKIDIVLHDVTTDPIPDVDLLFVRDVTIHLSDQDRRKLWNNWDQSKVPWILITHNNHVDQNFDVEYSIKNFPFSSVNWEIDPWNFPKPLEQVIDPQSNNMALWHRDQFQGIL